MAILVILLTILYIVIGLIISGFAHRDSWGDNAGSKVAVVIFWLFILLTFGLYYCVIGPYRLGEYIGDKIDDRKSR